MGMAWGRIDRTEAYNAWERWWTIAFENMPTRDGARGREGKDNLSSAIKSTFESRPARLRKAPDCAYPRDGFHVASSRLRVSFFFSRYLVTDRCLTRCLREQVLRNRWKWETVASRSSLVDANRGDDRGIGSMRNADRESSREEIRDALHPRLPRFPSIGIVISVVRLCDCSRLNWHSRSNWRWECKRLGAMPYGRSRKLLSRTLRIIGGIQSAKCMDRDSTQPLILPPPFPSICARDKDIVFVEHSILPIQSCFN